jgi:hypothetical protein
MEKIKMFNHTAFAALLLILTFVSGTRYSVSLFRMNNADYFISNSTSDWTYNYNAAYIPVPNSKGKINDALAVRV